MYSKFLVTEDPILNLLHMFTLDLEDELFATPELQKHFLEMLTRVGIFLGLHIVLPHWQQPEYLTREGGTVLLLCSVYDFLSLWCVN